MERGKTNRWNVQSRLEGKVKKVLWNIEGKEIDGISINTAKSDKMIHFSVTQYIKIKALQQKPPFLNLQRDICKWILAWYQLCGYACMSKSCSPGGADLHSETAVPKAFSPHYVRFSFGLALVWSNCPKAHYVGSHLPAHVSCENNPVHAKTPPQCEPKHS